MDINEPAAISISTLHNPRQPDRCYKWKWGTRRRDSRTTLPRTVEWAALNEWHTKLSLINESYVNNTHESNVKKITDEKEDA